MRSEHQFSNLQPPTASTDHEALEHIQSDVRRTRLQVEHHLGEYQSHVRRTRALWAIAIVVALSLIGMMWFSYPYLNEHRSMLGQLPALNDVLQRVGDRVNSVEEKLAVQASDGTGLMNRMSTLEQTVSSNFRNARTQAQTIATQVGLRLRDEMNASLRAIQNRITGVESTQRESAEHVAKLEDELANLRRELANIQQQTAQQVSTAQFLSTAQQNTSSEIFGLKGRLDSNANKINNVTDHLSRQRTDFEVSKNRTEQVAPGAYLTVRQTDVEQQSVDGWLQLAAEGRILHIRGQGAQRPIPFVTQQEQRLHELVFTRVGKNAVAGYVLVPSPVENALVTKE
jgi:predicted  nucleic acid-binding Zn-ribbon protein